MQFLEMFCGPAAWKIYSRLNAEHCSALASTCRHANTFYRSYCDARPTMAGSTRLYRRQVKALEWLRECYRRHREDGVAEDKMTAVLLNAYPSFGKTIVALEWISSLICVEDAANSPHVVVSTPKTVRNVWMEEMEKHYAGAPLTSGAGRSKKYTVGLNAAAKPGRICFVGQNSVFDATHFKFDAGKHFVFVIDEAHRNADSTNLLLNALTQKKGNMFVLLMSANIGAEKNFDPAPSAIYRAESSKMMTNQIKFETILAASVSGKTAELLEKYHDEPIVVLCGGVAPAMIRNSCPEKVDGRLVIAKYNKMKAALETFRSIPNGVFISSLKVAAEGQNFNTVRRLIVAASSATRSEMFQAVGRVCRDSNRHGEIFVTFVLTQKKSRMVHQIVEELIRRRGDEGEKRDDPELPIYQTAADAIFNFFKLEWSDFGPYQQAYLRSQNMNQSYEEFVLARSAEAGEDASRELAVPILMRLDPAVRVKLLIYLERLATI